MDRACCRANDPKAAISTAACFVPGFAAALCCCTIPVLAPSLFFYALNNDPVTTAIQNKKRFPVVPVLLFVAVFSAIIYYGYTHFFQKQTVAEPQKSGLNNTLPAQEPAKPLNKLELYLQAEKDSTAKAEQRSNDPYSRPVAASFTSEPQKKYSSQGLPIETPLSHDQVAEKEKQIDQQMVRISNSLRLQKSYPVQPPEKKEADTTIVPPPKNVAADPELKQLENMLDKLIDIQHPELVKQRNRVNNDSMINKTANTLVKHSVTAVVHGTQLLSNGSTIKLRLTQDLMLNGDTIPKGNFVYGTCSLNNERLSVTLTNLTCRNEIKPISLTVYDIDGMEGIYIPGAIARDVAKEGTEQAIQSVGLSSYDPSLTGQVASAGLQATKAFLSRKVKMIRVTVKAGHRILLQNTHGF